MHNWFLLSVWIHVLAAVVWVGGLLFIVMVFMPVLRHPELRGDAALLIRTTGQKFKRIAWASLWVLLLTGVANLYFKTNGNLEAMKGIMGIAPYGHIVGTKILLLAIVMGLALLHDFKWGPAATRAMQDDPDSDTARALRKKAGWVGRINLGLSLVILTLGLFLVYGIPRF